MFRRGAKADDAPADGGSPGSASTSPMSPPSPQAVAAGSVNARVGRCCGGICSTVRDGNHSACAWACGCCFAGASNRTCAEFAKATRSQQALLLAVGVASFWIAMPLYVVSFKAFAYGICIGSLIFCAGLVYDVRLIGETTRAADAARAFSPALADALTLRNAWRWYAFALNLVGSALTILGCLMYIQASEYVGAPGSVKGKTGQAALPEVAQLEVWRANAVFGASLVVFTAGFVLLSVDAMLTMRDVARATGGTEPGLFDETRLVLIAFGSSLGLLSVANLAILLKPPIFDDVAAVAGIAGVLLITAASAAQLRMQWRDFAAGAGGFWDPVALEEAAEAAVGAAAKARKSRWGFGGGGGGGGHATFGRASGLNGGSPVREEGEGVHTPLLGVSGGTPPPAGEKRSMLACCFGRGAGAQVVDDVASPPPDGKV
jgi:hypothetical protein